MKESDFKLYEKIGSGAYGTVYKALDTVRNTIVAAKIICIQQQEQWYPFLKEIDMVIDMNDPTIVNYHGWFFSGQTLWIIMEYCAGGSLSDILDALAEENPDTSKPLLEEVELAALCHGILQGLCYIHSLNKIHRDIKSANILITSDGLVKLCDFGVSAQLETTVNKTFTQIGTPYWMAPEVIEAKSGHNTKADIWSFGITVFELITGLPPNSDLGIRAALMKIAQSPPPEPPEYASPLLKAFLARALVKDPSKRATAAELLADPFIKLADPHPNEIVRTFLENYYAIKRKQEQEQDQKQEEEEEEEDSGLELGESNMRTMITGTNGQFATLVCSTSSVAGDTEGGEDDVSTMVVNSGESYVAPSWQVTVETPQDKEITRKMSKKRPFHNFTMGMLKSTLEHFKTMALDCLSNPNYSPNMVRTNYEDVRQKIIEEMKRNDPSIPDDYEKLP